MRKIDLKNEKNFENRKASGENIRARQSKFYWATMLPIIRHKTLTLEAIKEKKVLEIGCASGVDAIDYCKVAKKYIGVDISDVAINNCKQLGLKNAKFTCVDGHQLPVADASVDFVIVNSLLHHLDLEIAFQEIHRILVDDGALIFREPLGTNPLFGLYRSLTPSARTVDERPFTFSDLALMNSYFELKGELQWFGFLSIGSAFLKLALARSFLTSLDNLISYTPIKYFMWQFSGVVKKKRTAAQYIENVGLGEFPKALRR